MTTDPVARHHAQILDWLSAALTDPDTTMIYLHQDADEAGTWEIHADRKVDPAKEATAASQADRDALYTLAGTYRPPEWVDEADMDPDPYDIGGVLRAEEEFTPDPVTGACRCADCQALDAMETPFNPTATWKKVREAIDSHVARQADQALQKPEESPADYLQRRYGKADPAAWWANVGRLKPGQKVTNDEGSPVDWDKALTEDVDWKSTDHGEEITATFTGPRERLTDLLLAFYAHDDEADVIVHLTEPESIQKAKDDLFRDGES